ncbi:MAG: hydrolase [Betaproteobacteria bacterium CG2_30_59_46]|nr:MAG: hydrolase [Betaproteobacteria bacterium CG2_30_59_46]PIQ12577.1 MAG: hydrolase [Hydrogenophilales bacterium CG18_big_fil_WC_8_21_14_2_50_58_12]PIX98769.1 MAG: hydrolase [Hydrogenophilales bacterium CG_4_10_14_3_um_filter_58_23]PJB04950.1 MAG: hydrolase [Hydrogenophilales bacterium CG_4_9_14_3_um_filter_59_35]
MKTTESSQLVNIPAGPVNLEGMLELPADASGIVLFAHGSGSSRLSPRNNYVARVLRDAGLGTLLIDLLTRQEDMDYATRFDIPLLTRRLLDTTRWLRHEERTESLAIGYFGASTGAAAALQAAAAEGGKIAAVVSRGGRPDLAGEDALGRVAAPTLLIVGGFDDVVIGLNQAAYRLLKCEKELVIVPGATHLFEEPGTLEQVAKHAANWFSQRLSDKAA